MSPIYLARNKGYPFELYPPFEFCKRPLPTTVFVLIPPRRTALQHTSHQRQILTRPLSLFRSLKNPNSSVSDEPTSRRPLWRLGPPASPKFFASDRHRRHPSRWHTAAAERRRDEATDCVPPPHTPTGPYHLCLLVGFSAIIFFFTDGLRSGAAERFLVTPRRVPSARGLLLGGNSFGASEARRAVVDGRDKTRNL